MAKSKEEADKWVEFINKAASTSKISKRQSEILEKLRESGEGEEDTTNDSSNGPNGSFEEETYDDLDHNQQINKDDSSLEPMMPSKPPPLPVEDEQETYDDLDVAQTSSPQPDSQMPEVPSANENEEIYDDIACGAGLNAEEAPPPQPERRPVSDIQTTNEAEELYDDIGILTPPPVPPQTGIPKRPISEAPTSLSEAPKRPVSVIQPTNEDEEDEIYDDIAATQTPPPLPPSDGIPKRPVPEVKPTEDDESEEVYDDVGTQGKKSIYQLF